MFLSNHVNDAQTVNQEQVIIDDVNDQQTANKIHRQLQHDKI